MKLTLGIVVSALLVWGVATAYGWKADALAAGLEVDRMEALQDTTRVRVLTDSLRIVERRVVQTEQERDALDDQLGIQTTAKIAAEVRVDSLRASGQSVTVVDLETDTRTVHIDTYTEPYRIEAEIIVPPTPHPARWSFGVTMDPILLSVRLSCGTKDYGTIIPALVQVSAPRWARIGLDSVEQEPGICNPTFFELPTTTSLAARIARPTLLIGGALLVLKFAGVL